MERIIECVPNFSEGRNKEVIDAIVASIEKAGGVKVLDVDPGEATNRTVVTVVGSPEAVVEAVEETAQVHRYCGVQVHHRPDFRHPDPGPRTAGRLVM